MMSALLISGVWLVLTCNAQAAAAGAQAAPLPPARSASAKDFEVKAGLFYNFAKFTVWPALPTGSRVVFCVVGAEEIAALLVDTVRGMSVGGHTLEVQRPVDHTRWKDCHLLFLADTGLRQRSGDIGGIRTEPVLTVSDSKGFARSGGMIELYLADGKMAFSINQDAVERSGLRLSSRLLKLADLVRDTHAK